MIDPHAVKRKHFEGDMEHEVIATCGHKVVYLDYPGNPHARERRARFTDHDCSACRQARARAQELEARMAKIERGKKIAKGQHTKYLPAGALIALKRLPDGRWIGELSGAELKVSAEGSGLMGLVSTLAKAWIKAKAKSVAPK